MAARRPAGSRMELAIVLACGLLVAAANGAGYGLGANHPVYLIPGLHLADPAFLAADWWTARTTHYHVVFAWLVAGLARLGLLPWGLVALNWAAIVALVAGAWRLVRLLGGPAPLATTLLLLALYFGLYQTRTAGEVSLVGYGLEPAIMALGAVLWGWLCAARGRDLAAGLALAAAAACHLQIGVLAVGLLGLAQFGFAPPGFPQAGFWRRAAVQLGPAALVLAAQAPLVLRVAGLDLPAEVRAEASAIFFATLPQHYQPLTALATYVDLLAWALLALPFLDVAMPGKAGSAGRRVAVVLAILAGLTALHLLLTTAVFVPAAARLFVTRLSPLLVLGCQAVLLTALLRALLDRDWRPDHVGARLVCAAGGLVLLAALPSNATLVHFPSLRPVLAAGWAGLGLLLAAGLLRPAWRGRLPRGALAAAGAALFGGLLLLGGFARDSYDAVAPPAALQPDEELYRWAAATPADSVFVIPPELSRFRLRAGRAVVVEAKALPFRPDEMLDWKRRLDAVAGDDRSAALDFGGATLVDFYRARYAGAVAGRLPALARDYGATHLVWRRADGDPGLGRAPVFANARYAVYPIAS